jgi:hypothetical protein
VRPRCVIRGQAWAGRVTRGEGEGAGLQLLWGRRALSAHSWLLAAAPRRAGARGSRGWLPQQWPASGQRQARRGSLRSASHNLVA